MYLRLSSHVSDEDFTMHRQFRGHEAYEWLETEFSTASSAVKADKYTLE